MAITRVSGTSFTNLQKFDNFATDFGAVTGNYVALQTYTVDSGGATSITFSSIPQNYKHLQLRIIGRCAFASTGATSAKIEYNSDTTATNYYYHALNGNGSTAAAFAANSPAYTFVSLDNSNTASTFSGGVVDILDYTNTNKYKTTRALSGWDANGSGVIYLTSQLWKSTSAITSMTVTAGDGNWTQYTSFALFGIAG